MQKHGPEKAYIPKAKYIITVMIFFFDLGAKYDLDMFLTGFVSFTYAESQGVGQLFKEL